MAGNGTHGSTVVVGVDGSDSAVAALDWAVAEATARQAAKLRIVHGFIWPLYRVELGSSPYGPEEGGLRATADEVVAAAVERARAVAPELAVEGVLHVGGAAAALVDESAGAQLLVVGSRGLGGFTGLLLGSVSSQVAAHADCPVVVVRPSPQGAADRHGQVVVGVEDLAGSTELMEFAADEAARLGTGLTVMHCSPPALTVTAMPGPAMLYDDTELVEAERRRFVEMVEGWVDKRPEIVIHPHFSRRPPAWALVEASAQARLVVVGSRGRGGFVGLLLGSVSRQLLHHANGPVAVIPTGRGRA